MWGKFGKDTKQLAGHPCGLIKARVEILKPSLCSLMAILLVAVLSLTGCGQSKSSQAIFEAGRQKMKVGDYPGAIQDFTVYLQRWPNSGPAYANRAMAEL